MLYCRPWWSDRPISSLVPVFQLAGLTNERDVLRAEYGRVLR